MSGGSSTAPPSFALRDDVFIPYLSVQFTSAEIATEVDVTCCYVRGAVRAHNLGTLTAVDAAKAKWWATEVHERVVDPCVQLFGSYGYMTECPTEIMKILIARDVLGKFA